MTVEKPTQVAVYERVIAASLTRIWENVLDWEHLPWLHSSSFRTVELVDESPAGWSAWITSRLRAQESLASVEVDRPALRYLSRTTDGEGAGSEIWTYLEPTAARATRIRVEFAVSSPDPEHAAKIGQAYVRLYTRLWDEDEAMMVRRQRLLDENGGRVSSSNGTVASVPLGRFDELASRLPLVVRVAGRELRLVAIDGEILAHPTTCPHLGGPLDAAAVEDGCITCPWHGYRYDLRTGRSANGRAVVLGPPRRVHRTASGEAELVG